MGKTWPALVIRDAARVDAEPTPIGDSLAAVLDDFSPAAIEDLAEMPIPAGGLWDPTFPPLPEPPPTPLYWRVFFQNAADRVAAADAIASAYPQLSVTAVDIEDEDWAARSQGSLTAVRAGSFIVAPPWDLPELVDTDVTIVVIEPSMGFGTGHHATTRLCLRLMSPVDFQGKDVIDLGTGSGVLAMAAALRGARTVRAIDVDEDAVASAEASARLNPPLPSLRFLLADFRSTTQLPADIVVANLTAGMLSSAATAVTALVQPGGQLIVSGFDESEAAGVQSALPGFEEVSRATEESWVALSLFRADAQ